jgi:hypothetical protein
LVIVIEPRIEMSRRIYFPYPTQSPVRLWRALRREWAPDSVNWVLNRVKVGRHL